MRGSIARAKPDRVEMLLASYNESLLLEPGGLLELDLGPVEL